MHENLVKLCLDRSKNQVKQYTNEQADDIIRKAFIDIMGTDSPTPRQFRKHEREIFEVIEIVLDQRVIDGWTQNPFFKQFVEYRDLNEGDSASFYVEDRSMLVFSEVARGTWNLRRQKLNVGNSFTVPTRVYGAAVYTDFRRFISGRIDWSAFIRKVDEALNHMIASEIYATFVSTVDYLPANFTSSGSFDANELMRIIQHVKAANGNSQIAIAGTLMALSNLYEGFTSTWVSEEMKEQLNKQGGINFWMGYPLLEIPQVHVPNTFDFMVTDDLLMVLPLNTKPIKFVREGESYIKEISDETTNMDMSLEYKFLTQFGIAVIFNVFYGMYDLVSGS